MQPQDSGGVNSNHRRGRKQQGGTYICTQEKDTAVANLSKGEIYITTENISGPMGMIQAT